MSKRAEELATKIGTMAIRMAFRGDMLYRVEAAALIDAELHMGEEMKAQMDLLTTNIHFLKMAIQADDPKSELVLRCEDIHRAALATPAEDKEPVSNTYKSEACPECGVFPPFAHNPGCKIGEAYL
jgi:hypothetical protein